MGGGAMKSIVTTTYAPEVGDRVLFREEDANVESIGVITSFGYHCNRCPRWCDVAVDGKIKACPNIQDMEWSDGLKMWLAIENLPEDWKGAGSEYSLLKEGEIIRSDDEAYTFADPDCKTMGWVPLPGMDVVGKPFSNGMVRIRRKR
jgi:hypothetical protein